MIISPDLQRASSFLFLTASSAQSPNRSFDVVLVLVGVESSSKRAKGAKNVTNGTKSIREQKLLPIEQKISQTKMSGLV